MLAMQLLQNPLQTITWEKLPDDFILPDEPVDNNLQPLLAAALRESMELAGLILESMLIASNFGLCATVKTQTVVKAPDWVYISSVKPIPSGTIRRSYTPHLEGGIPSIVLEFISETEGVNIPSTLTIPMESGIFTSKSYKYLSMEFFSQKREN
jgi:hypothetical protein